MLRQEHLRQVRTRHVKPLQQDAASKYVSCTSEMATVADRATCRDDVEGGKARSGDCPDATMEIICLKRIDRGAGGVPYGFPHQVACLFPFESDV